MAGSGGARADHRAAPAPSFVKNASNREKSGARSPHLPVGGSTPPAGAADPASSGPVRRSGPLRPSTAIPRWGDRGAGLNLSPRKPARVRRVGVVGRPIDDPEPMPTIRHPMHFTLRRTALLLPLAALLAVSLGSPATAQKVERKEQEFPEHGFKFKNLEDWTRIPLSSDASSIYALRFEQESRGQMLDAGLIVYSYEAEKAVSDDGEKKDDEEEGRRRRPRQRQPELLEVLQDTFSGLGTLEGEPTMEEELEIDDLKVVHKRYDWEYEDVFRDGRTKVQPRCLNVYTYALPHATYHFVYYVIYEEFDRRWERAVETSAESFERIERVVPEEIDISERDYASQLAWAEQEAARLGDGWAVEGTPSERFVILTHCDDHDFVKEAINRLEVSRDIYEEDFPPPPGFDAVSLVRICKDREEFQKFSGMGGGTAGYFSPQSVELVLFDNVSMNRNSTYAVLSHEAFHQYCHFLFDESEAHRWFDEGHGDYYGGLDIKGRRGKITPRMPGGLDRLPTIREMVSQDKTFPLEEHLNASHGEWQSGGVPSYCQSWSIIYMLRQGMEKNVSRRYWNKEYADIIPNYTSTLTQGFREAYAEILADMEEQAEKRGKELTPGERKINRFRLRPDKKEEIWKKAMEASWGQIDLAEFEEKWKAYVEKGI